MFRKDGLDTKVSNYKRAIDACYRMHLMNQELGMESFEVKPVSTTAICKEFKVHWAFIKALEAMGFVEPRTHKNKKFRNRWIRKPGKEWS